MPPRTKVRRRSDGGDGMGHDPESRAIRRRVKEADTRDTWGFMAIVITGEGDSPGEVITRTHAGQLRREADSTGAALADLLRGKMAFVYESDLEPDRPGWFLAMDREVCLHPALGDSLIPLGEPRRLRDLLLEAGVTECRWVSTAEREQRQPSLW